MTTGIAYVDTTLRDLATPPWGTAMDADDLSTATTELVTARPALLEVMDSRAASTALEVRGESPWDRLRSVVRESGDVPVGLIVSGRTLWGTRPLGADVVARFAESARTSGVARVRGFDPLNNADMLVSLAEGCGDGVEFVPTLIIGAAPAAGDPRWVAEARALAALPGVTTLALADKAGHLSPGELAALVKAAREATGLRIEVQVQAPGGLAPLLALAAVNAGAQAIQASTGAAAVIAARPSVESMRAALKGTALPLDCDEEGVAHASRAVGDLIPAEQLRRATNAVYGSAVGLPPDLEAAVSWRMARHGLERIAGDAVAESARVAEDLGGLTLAHPLGEAIVSQAAQHLVEGERWREIDPILAQAALGHIGPLRGDVAPEARAAAEAASLPEEHAAPANLAQVRADGPERTSEEDLVLWAQFGDLAESLLRRRRSLGGELLAAPEEAGISRDLLETLVDVVERSGEAEVSVEVGGSRVTVRRGGGASAAVAPPPSGEPAPAAAPSPSGVRVESPMVGTFYRSPSPEEPSFVEVGQPVEAGQVLCLLEAMKLFNEITAETGGTIKEIAVEDSDPVEFGQLLFVIEP